MFASATNKFTGKKSISTAIANTKFAAESSCIITKVQKFEKIAFYKKGI